jgi:hypothetical protein
MHVFHFFFIILIEIFSHADHFNIQSTEALSYAMNNKTKNADTDSSEGNRYASNSKDFISLISYDLLPCLCHIVFFFFKSIFFLLIFMSLLRDKFDTHAIHYRKC